MARAERELWQKYLETLAQKKRLEEFLVTLRKPKESQKLATKAYEDILVGVHAKINSLTAASLVMKSAVEKIDQRLESPDFKKNILLVTHQILQGNTHARKMLRRASVDLDKAIDQLSNALVNQTIEEPQDIFKTREVYDLIRRHFFGLKKEHEKTLDLKIDLQRQVISPQRALAMAKNIFVRGDYKKLRETIRLHKKASQRLAQKLLVYSQQEKNFKSTDWTIFPRSTFLQQQYYLTKQGTMLELERARLDQLGLSLQNKQAELDARCQESESQKQIEIIAAGILRKNFKHVHRLEEVEARAKELVQRMTHAKEQMTALKERLSLDKHATYYKVVSPDVPSKEKAASLIADAILQDPQAVQLVARSTGNNLEMEKDWELMSELDKDELIRKRIVREL